MEDYKETITINLITLTFLKKIKEIYSKTNNLHILNAFFYNFDIVSTERSRIVHDLSVPQTLLIVVYAKFFKRLTIPIGRTDLISFCQEIFVLINETNP